MIENNSDIISKLQSDVNRLTEENQTLIALNKKQQITLDEATRELNELRNELKSRIAV